MERQVANAGAVSDELDERVVRDVVELRQVHGREAARVERKRLDAAVGDLHVAHQHHSVELEARLGDRW